RRRRPPAVVRYRSRTDDRPPHARRRRGGFASMTRRLLALALLAVGPALAARGQPPRQELDFVADGKLLDARFSRYGYAPSRSILREETWLRFWLPAGAQGVGQTGLYSTFVIAGDFEGGVQPGLRSEEHTSE